MESLLKHLWRDETGQDLIEYALLAGFVATASSVIMPVVFRDNVLPIFSRVNSCMIRLANH